MHTEITDAKDIIDKAKEAASSTQEYINATKEIIGEQGTISKLQSFGLKLDGIGHVSTALGIIGAGLELAIMLSGQPSPMEQIINMLSNISDQISNLEDKMNYQFDRLKTYVSYTALKVQMSAASSAMNENIALMNEYIEVKKKPNEPDYKERCEDLEERLKNIKRSDVLSQAQVLSDLIKGGSGLEKILDVSIDYTYGDIRNVMIIGNAILNYTFTALSLDGLLSGLEYRDKKIDNNKIIEASSKNAQELYWPLINSIKIALSQAIDTITQEDKCTSYAKSYCEHEILPRLTVDDINITAKNLGKLLSSQWFWYNWTIIVYDSVTGSQWHGVDGEFANYFSQKVSNGKLNFVIGRINKENANNLDLLRDFAKEARKLKIKNYNTDFYIEDTINEFIAKKKELKITEGMLWLYNDQSSGKKYGFFTNSFLKLHVWNDYEMEIFSGGPEFCNVVLHA